LKFKVLFFLFLDEKVSKKIKAAFISDLPWIGLIDLSIMSFFF